MGITKQWDRKLNIKPGYRDCEKGKKEGKCHYTVFPPRYERKEGITITTKIKGKTNPIKENVEKKGEHPGTPLIRNTALHIPNPTLSHP